jgi:hypothetical protein
MATHMVIKGLTRTDRVVAWTMIAGLALALVQYAQDLALPTHFL